MTLNAGLIKDKCEGSFVSGYNRHAYTRATKHQE